MVEIVLPRYVSAKPTSTGRTAFYWTCPSAYRKAGYPIKAKPLGINISQDRLDSEAAALNAGLDAWRRHRNNDTSPGSIVAFGSVAWLFRAYLLEDAFLERVDAPNRSDYERAYKSLAAIPMKSGRSFGELPVSAVSPAIASGIYKKLADTGALRSAEKSLMYASTCWRRMKPLQPGIFPDGGNPWDAVTKRRREKAVKPAVTREEVYAFANGAIGLGRYEAAAAAVICFEWLMRPRNVSAGLCTWSDYRGKGAPKGIRIRHKKNRQMRVHPLEWAASPDSEPIRLYAEAEAILGQVPRIGLSIVCNHLGQPFGESSTRLSQIVAEAAKKLGMDGFTLDACRHGGMTELEEMSLTDGEGRALSAHQTTSSYAGYAKASEKRMLNATIQRREARLEILKEYGKERERPARQG